MAVEDNDTYIFGGKVVAILWRDRMDGTVSQSRLSVYGTAWRFGYSIPYGGKRYDIRRTGGDAEHGTDIARGYHTRYHGVSVSCSAVGERRSEEGGVESVADGIAAHSGGVCGCILSECRFAGDANIFHVGRDGRGGAIRMDNSGGMGVGFGKAGNDDICADLFFDGIAKDS